MGGFGGLDALVGRTITHVVVKGGSESPRSQVMLVFSDDSVFEFYCSDSNVSGSWMHGRGGVVTARSYISRNAIIEEHPCSVNGEIYSSRSAEGRAHARAKLIRGIAIPDLIDDLEGNRYGDLVLEHLQAGREQIASKIHAHEQLIDPEDRLVCGAVISAHTTQANREEFWGQSAGDILNSISCDLNDELPVGAVEDATIFICFQITTLQLAMGAIEDDLLRARIVSTPLAAPRRGGSGTITKILGIAISDFDAGRLSRKNLVLILQDAIDRGDILEPGNEEYVVSHVMPLIEAGALTRSPALGKFEERYPAALLKRKLAVGAIVLLGYLLAAEAWRMGALAPVATDAMRPIAKVVAVAVACLLLIGHTHLAIRWPHTSFRNRLWPVVVVTIAAAGVWGRQTLWVHRCNQCSVWDGVLFVGVAALIGAVAGLLVAVGARMVLRGRRRTL